MPTAVLGIDIAKATFDAALIHCGRAPKHRTFKNCEEGFAALSRWLSQQAASEVHACMEATGTYGDPLARYLVAQGHTVSVVNPSVTHAFARTELSRVKTDKADALRIARYCQMHQPPAWTPPREEIATLQALVRRLEVLQQMRQMERNRLEGTPSGVHDSIRAVLNTLDEQITAIQKQIREHIDSHADLKCQQALLTSIPGIGAMTATQLLAELGSMEFSRAGQAAAFVGLVPRQHLSGSSVRGRSSLCKMGRSRLRKALFFPAMVALRHNPLVRAMGERLAATGKSKMVILGAAMRKLVHLAFGVLKSRKAFHPQWEQFANTRSQPALARA